MDEKWWGSLFLICFRTHTCAYANTDAKLLLLFLTSESSAVRSHRLYANHVRKLNTCYSAYTYAYTRTVELLTHIHAHRHRHVDPDSLLFFLWQHLSLALSTYFMLHYPLWQQTRRRIEETEGGR